MFRFKSEIALIKNVKSKHRRKKISKKYIYIII